MFPSFSTFPTPFTFSKTQPLCPAGGAPLPVSGLPWGHPQGASLPFEMPWLLLLKVRSTEDNRNVLLMPKLHCFSRPSCWAHLRSAQSQLSVCCFCWTFFHNSFIPLGPHRSQLWLKHSITGLAKTCLWKHAFSCLLMLTEDLIDSERIKMFWKMQPS